MARQGVVAATIAALAVLAGVSPSQTAVAAQAPSRAALAIGDADGDGDIDLDDLIKRVSDSKAIGMLTKLSLKRDIDGFKRDMKTLHDGSTKSTLAELRERYDLLVHKLTMLLQDKDPKLARDIAQAREYLWGKVSDPKEFRRL